MADEPRALVVDTTHMKFRDLRVLMKLSRTQPDQTMNADDMEKMIDTLDRFVVGGIDDFEVTELPAIAKAIGDAIAQENKTKN